MHILHEIFEYLLLGSAGIAAMAVIWLPAALLLRKKIPLLRQLSYFLFVSILLIILSATVFCSLALKISDGSPVIASVRHLNLSPFDFISENPDMGNNKKIAQAAANVIMFIPLGFITPAAFGCLSRFWKTSLFTACVSFAIEFIQYYIGRSADIDDLILNTAGGMLGYLIFSIINTLIKGNNPKKRTDNMCEKSH